MKEIQATMCKTSREMKMITKRHKVTRNTKTLHWLQLCFVSFRLLGTWGPLTCLHPGAFIFSLYTRCTHTHTQIHATDSYPSLVLLELQMAYQVFNLSSEWHHPKHTPRRTVCEREGGENDFREGELAQQWSVRDLAETPGITGTHCQGHGSGHNTGRHTHGGTGGPGPGHGGDRPRPAAEAVTEGELPQRLTAGSRHWLHDR